MKTLVLTPHPPLLPEKGSVMFSGGWCLTPDILGCVADRSLDFDVAPYHWNDREKYYKDYLYLRSVYECYLEATSTALNNIHSVRYGTEYWRILAGPALYTVLCHLLDRWCIARDLMTEGEFDRVPLIDFRQYAFTPKLTVDLNPDCHDYNHYLMSSALIFLGVDQTKCERLKVQGFGACKPNTAVEPRPSGVKEVTKWAKRLVERVVASSGLTQGGKVLIVSSYLPRLYELLLNVICLNLPSTARITCDALPSIDPSRRAALHFDVKRNDPFCQFASHMLPALLPIYLVEGYSQLAKCWSIARWPMLPRAIFTSNAFQFDEVFQHYAATQKACHGAKLIIGQHGGVSGILKWSFGEEHQTRIADKFVSWGWGAGDPKIEPGFVLTNFGQRIRNSANGCLLLTTVPMRRYSHKGGAWPVGPEQSAGFLADQLKFYQGLSTSISSRTILRIFASQDRRFGTGYVEAWKHRFPQVEVDNSTSPIKQVLRKTKLFVYTYNSTGYLECLSMNFPTVMFWDPKLFETKKVFTDSLANLERVGIFHSTPESAAKHINQVWDELESWWDAPHVQQARQQFVDEFARPPRVRDLGLIRKLLVG